MIQCLTCTRPTQLYLCDDCTTTLGNMIAELPWLIDELDNRIQRLDRTNTSTAGRSSRQDALNVMDFDAAETARKAHKAIRDLVTVINGPGPVQLQCTVTHDFIGPLRPAWRRLPADYKPRPVELIDWLMRRTTTIARHPKAGHVYRELARLVGDTQRGGILVRAINPVEHHLVGPCPTITGRHHNGTPRTCGHMLFADTYDRTVDCPTCQQTIDVRATRERAAAERDLHTKTGLAEILTNIDEPVDPARINQWIQARRLRPRGWFHRGAIVQLQIDDSDEPAYSVERARRLRRRDTHLRNRTRGAART